jgi:hypothetical protein
MAVCDDCSQEMTTAAICTADVLILVDERFGAPGPAGCTDVDGDRVFVCAVADGVVVHPASLRGLRMPSTRYPLRELVAGGPP